MADRTPTSGPSASRGADWHRWLLIGGLLFLLLLMALNFQKVTVHLILTTIQMPLIVALLIAAVLGAAVGWAVPRFRRTRQRD